MNRVPGGAYSEAIAEAYRILEPPMADRLRGVDFLCGVNPVWAGLHGFSVFGLGQADATRAHCAYPHHTNDRTTTVVLPIPEAPWVIVHELGHALHARLDWEPWPDAVSEYAKTDEQEAFAEFFTARYFWHGDQGVYHGDLKHVALLDHLAGVAS